MFSRFFLSYQNLQNLFDQRSQRGKENMFAHQSQWSRSQTTFDSFKDYCLAPLPQRVLEAVISSSHQASDSWNGCVLHLQNTFPDHHMALPKWHSPAEHLGLPLKAHHLQKGKVIDWFWKASYSCSEATLGTCTDALDVSYKVAKFRDKAQHQPPQLGPAWVATRKQPRQLRKVMREAQH